MRPDHDGVPRLRRELELLSERRGEIRRLLSLGHDAALAAEARQLDARTQALWQELRRLRAVAAYGPRESILARARAHDRLDHELRRRLRRTPASGRAGAARLALVHSSTGGRRD